MAADIQMDRSADVTAPSGQFARLEGFELAAARTRRSDYAHVVQHAARALAALEHRGDHQVRAAHHVAAGKHLRIGGLERARCGRGHAHPTAWMERNIVWLEPVWRA